ncbi:hypothetical protein [Cytobacillus purgationiresistens]|uniref:TMhelix containing protein n=1 Tax=Cytobacillus purgationiresistens TaxID=863449 RepID=A0ABU0AHN2_9BACI|nr:hypothetical protein [Cytobacillus purgationiresistens]MDQ0270764.1 hypothetical protein [Cytobacillus purgationiresistens]
MKEEIFSKATEYIDAIAANLGVAAEHVYGLMVQQKFTEGVAETIVGVLMLILFIVTLTLVIGAYLNPKYKTVGDGYLKAEVPSNIYAKVYELIDRTDGFAHMIIVPFLLLTALFGTLCIYSGILTLINPEYYAIKEILDAFGGGK